MEASFAARLSAIRGEDLKRRAFLAGIMAMGILAGAGLRLPKRQAVEVEPELNLDKYFTGPNPWLIMTSQQSLIVRPTKLIIPPHLQQRAVEILSRKPTLWNRISHFFTLPRLP